MKWNNISSDRVEEVVENVMSRISLYEAEIGK